jgi:protein-disulfide isomerase
MIEQGKRRAVMANDPKKPQAKKGQQSQSENARIRQRRAQRRAQEEAKAAQAAPASGASAARTAERRREREQEKQRRRLTSTALVIGGLALLIAFVVIVTNLPAEAPIPENTSARYAGLPIGSTEQGYPRLGSATATVQVVVYSSFDCAACRNIHDQLMDRIIERVRAGSIAFTFIPRFGTGEIVNGQGAAEAALCAGEQGKFWEMHDALFTWQGLYGNQAFTNNRIVTGAEKLGLNMSAFDGCARSDSTVPILETARQQALNAGFAGTPTFTINGVQPVDENGTPILSADGIIAEIDRRIAEFSTTAPSNTQTQPAPEATEPAESAVRSEATPEVESTPEAEAAPEIEVTPEVTTEA